MTQRVEKCLEQPISLRLPPPLKMALMELAQRDQRSLGEYIRVVCERHAFGHLPSGVGDDEASGRC